MVCGKYSLKSLKYEKLSKLNLLTIAFLKEKLAKEKLYSTQVYSQFLYVMKRMYWYQVLKSVNIVECCVSGKYLSFKKNN